MDWSEQVVLITGASSGIGRAFAMELVRRGAKLGLVARRAEILHEIIAELNPAQQVNALALPADVQDAQSMRLVAEQLITKFGRIDVLIANAGVGVTNPGTQFDPAKFAAVVNVNVIGVANSVAAVLPEMVTRGSGQLVAISSLAAYRGLPESAAYCASKAGVSAMFESLRLDLAPRGITVTIIHPGFIKTPLTAGREAKLPWLMESDDAVNQMLRAIEQRKKSYAFPWQLATIGRLGTVMSNLLYDSTSSRTSA